MIGNDIMGFSEKVALVCLGVITFQIACVFSIPIWPKEVPTKIYQNNYIKPDNNLFNSESTQSVKKKPPSILKSFNFPKVEFTSEKFAKPLRPKTILKETSNVKAIDHSDYLNNLKKEKRRKRKYGGLKMPDENIIGEMNINKQNYLSQIEAFPQMEFPLTASETWAPNFWNQLAFPLYDPYLDFDKNMNEPQISQKLIQTQNSMKKGKYPTITNKKTNNKIDLTPKKKNTVSMNVKPGNNVLLENDKTFAEMKMPNTTTISKPENNNNKTDITENSKPKRKPRKRKIKIITKSSNVLKDLIAKKSNTSTCSVDNNSSSSSSNDCSLKNQTETTNHAISNVINDKNNTEISDLLSDDFDVCFVTQNPSKTTDDNSQICVSFDHDTSTKEPVSDTIKLSKKDYISMFNESLKHTVKTESNCSVMELDKSDEIIEKIIISDVPEVEKLTTTDKNETVSPFDNNENKIIFQTLHVHSPYVSKEYPTKILTDIHQDELRNHKSSTINSSHLENYELLEEVKDVREIDTDTVLSELEQAIVDSKIDGTINMLIPKIKQAILEAIVESAAFVPSHIATGYSTDRQSAHYDKTRFIMNDVEFINTDEEYIDSPDFMKEKYTVPSQTTEFNVIETLNLTEPKTNNLQNALLDDKEVDNKTKPPEAPIKPSQNSILLNPDKVDVTVVEIVEKQTETENKEIISDLLIKIDNSLNNITDSLANQQSKDLQTANITTTESDSNYTNNAVYVDFSTTETTVDSLKHDDLAVMKILLKSINNADENNHDGIKIIVKSNNLPNEELTENIPLSHVLETNNKINAAYENSGIANLLDNINGYIIFDQDNDTDKEMMKIVNDTNDKKLEDYVLFTDIVESPKQDITTSSISSSDIQESNINSSETKNYKNNQKEILNNPLEQDEQITPSRNRYDLKENNDVFIDQIRWGIDEENLNQTLLNSDLETRILYANEREIDSEPHIQLFDALEIDDKPYFDYNFDTKITRGSGVESNNTMIDKKVMIGTETLSESSSREIKSDLNLSDNPSTNDEFSSDEFTEEILNAILEILCIEDSECNNNINTNNTLYDNIKLADYTASIETKNKTKKNADGTTILNEDKNVVLYAEENNISNENNDTVVSLLDNAVNDGTPNNTISENFDDEIINTKNNKLVILDETQINNGSSQDLQDKEITDKAPEMTSDIKTVNEKQIYPKISSNNDSNEVGIDVRKLQLVNIGTKKVADNEDLNTLNINHSLLNNSSSEKDPGEENPDNNGSVNRVTDSINDKLNENYPSTVKTVENDQNTVIVELFPDSSDA